MELKLVVASERGIIATGERLYEQDAAFSASMWVIATPPAWSTSCSPRLAAFLPTSCAASRTLKPVRSVQRVKN
ncbi:MAG: hypothetical protein IPK48_15160 [Gammaproteobacteria bacterium]|nr:hypothetical protein [Gammaproteobacteria bacterium]